MTVEETLQYVEQRYSNMPPSVQMLYKEYITLYKEGVRLLKAYNKVHYSQYAKLIDLAELVGDVMEELNDR